MGEQEGTICIAGAVFGEGEINFLDPKSKCVPPNPNFRRCQPILRLTEHTSVAKMILDDDEID